MKQEQKIKELLKMNGVYQTIISHEYLDKDLDGLAHQIVEIMKPQVTTEPRKDCHKCHGEGEYYIQLPDDVGSPNLVRCDCVEPQVEEGLLLSDDEIDGTRFRVLDELEKKAKINWWDICKAVEETLGKQASLDAEQFLIDITNKTGQEVVRDQHNYTKRECESHHRAEIAKLIADNFLDENGNDLRDACAKCKERLLKEEQEKHRTEIEGLIKEIEIHVEDDYYLGDWWEALKSKHMKER